VPRHGGWGVLNTQERPAVVESDH